MEVDASTLAHPEIYALWQDAGLPFPSGTPRRIWYQATMAAHHTVGIIGIEPYVSGALLRSLVVAPELRRRGLGGQLVWCALSWLQTAQVNTAYVVTETAQDFWASWDFSVIDRQAIPEDIQATDELSGSCPASASVMRLSLTRAVFRVRTAQGDGAPRNSPLKKDRIVTWETMLRTDAALPNRDPRYGILVVENSHGEVVGWLALSPFSVSPAAKGVAAIAMDVERPAATQLLRAGIDWARSHNCHQLMVKLLPDNLPAKQIYVHQGFHSIGILREPAQLNGQGHDVEIMEYLFPSTDRPHSR